MTASITQPALTSPALQADNIAASNDVTSLLGSARSEGSDDQDMRSLYRQIAGNLFYGTLMRQIRDSAFKSDLFHGGRGEDVFSGQLHQQYIDTIAGSSQQDVTAEIADAIMRRMQNGYSTHNDSSDGKVRNGESATGNTPQDRLEVWA